MGTPAPVVDRRRETELLEAALRAGAHVVLEGPPGTGKSTLLRALASRRDSALVLVEGNAELTPARLVGHFDPALVLDRGYRPDVFVDGPLLDAMRGAGLLYLEELNRVPEETLNVLLTVMSEREIAVPRLGTVRAEPGFGIVAAMNPYDAVGTARVSSAVYDRTCRIVMGYQSAESEQAILTQQAPIDSPEWAAKAVALVRATRDHPELRVGSSVRGTIDLAGLTHELALVRGVPPTHWRTGLDAAFVALSGRVKVDESSSRTAEEVVEELYVATFGPEPSSDEPDPSDGGRPAGGSLSPPPAGAGGSAAPPKPQPSRRGRPQRTTGRAELSRHARFEEMSPEVGELDTAAVRDAVADDPDDVLPLLMQMSTATDPALRAKVQALVPRLVLERARSGTRGGSGAGRLRRSPADRGGDLDVDASLEAIGQARGEQRPPGLEELTATTWHRPRTALCLLVDRSGSMDGSRLVTAAMAAAACALRAEGELSVIAFDRTPEVLLDLHAPSPPLRTVQRVLGLRGHGMTSMDAAFRAAADQLRGARATRRITIVLSDCRATDEVDAVPAARALEELVVIAPASDDEEARRVAREAGARVAAIESVDDLPRLLDQLLGR